MLFLCVALKARDDDDDDDDAKMSVLTPGGCAGRWRVTHPGNCRSLAGGQSNSWVAATEAPLDRGPPSPGCPSSAGHSSCLRSLRTHGGDVRI